jgi:hypothetical protein
LLEVLSSALAFVFPEFGHARDVDLSAFNHNQPQFGEFVQNARKMFLSQVEAGSDNAFVGR